MLIMFGPGYSGADLSALCREAAYGPIRSLPNIEHIDSSLVRPIIYADFIAATAQVRASVSQQDLRMYVEWNRQYGSFAAPIPTVANDEKE